MTAHDVPALTEAFASWGKPPDQYERYWMENEDGERVTFIAFIDGAVAGYGNLEWRSDYAPFGEHDIPEITDLNTLEQYRKRGVASAIIAACEALARKDGKPIIGIGVGKTPDYGNAQRLYPKLGYVFDGCGRQPSPWGDVEYLTKALAPTN